MRYELICVDIDGTLLDDRKKVLPAVKESLKRMADKGIKIAMISARMPAGLSIVEEELGIKCIKACNIGTYILRNDECIHAEYITLETMKTVMKLAKKHGIPLWIFSDEDWLVTGTDGYVEREAEVIRYQPEIVDAKKLAELWEMNGKRPNELSFAAVPEKIRAVYRDLCEMEFPDAEIPYFSEDAYLEIFPKGTGKGRALSTVCEALHVEPGKTVAFGDHELDIPMIEAAGLGIAMGNASQALKNKADFVTKTNNEAGIAYALEYYAACFAE